MRTLSVLGLWVAGAIVFSVVAALVLRPLAGFLTRNKPDEKERAQDLASVLPAALCGYLFCCLIVFAGWSEARGFNMTWGDSWREPMLGKYELVMVDTQDVGSIYHEIDKTDRAFWERADHYEIESGIRRLQIDPPYLLGAVAPAALAAGDAKAAPESLFFILNTRTGTDSHYRTPAQMEEAAQNFGLALHLEPTEQVYRENRYSRLDLIPLFLFLIPPAFALYYMLTPRPQRKHRSRSRKRSRSSNADSDYPGARRRTRSRSY